MKSIFLRCFLIATIAMLMFQDATAQRGGRRYYHHSYSYYRPRTYVSIGIGAPYYHYPSYYYTPYHSYRYYGGFIRPRIGIHVSILPVGYTSFYLGRDPYYYYGGSYYRSIPRSRDYEVIDAPMGASVPELPEGARVVVINDQKYYELDGTYYKEDIRDNNEIWYTVVGKNGRLDTDDAAQQDNSPVVGDVVDKLPDNCRTVTLNGHTYYVSPDDVYYEETMQHNTLRYKIVSK